MKLEYNVETSSQLLADSCEWRPGGVTFIRSYQPVTYIQLRLPLTPSAWPSEKVNEVLVSESPPT